MKKWIVLAAVALSGCAQINSYNEAVKTPAPPALQGNWQSVGPQSNLINPQAIASLIINAEGDTLDCRQWQRVIAKPGRLTRQGDDWVNVNRQSRVMPLDLDEGELHYDGLRLRKTDRPTVECQQALDEAAKRPNEAIIQNIEPEIMKPQATSAPQ